MEIYQIKTPNKVDTLSQCCYNAGPTSLALPRQFPGISSAFPQHCPGISPALPMSIMASYQNPHPAPAVNIANLASNQISDAQQSNAFTSLVPHEPVQITSSSAHFSHGKSFLEICDAYVVMTGCYQVIDVQRSIYMYRRRRMNIRVLMFCNFGQYIFESGQRSRVPEEDHQNKLLVDKRHV